MTVKPIQLDLHLPIETPRMVIRATTINDAVEITEAKKVVWPQLQRWMSWANDGEETLASTERAIARRDQDNLLLGGFCRLTGRFVVATGLHREGDEFATGYWIAKDFLGQGYATEATNAVLRYAFAIGIPRMGINHFEGNEKSRRVIEKLGFTKTGIRKDYKINCATGKPVDGHEYIMTDPKVLPPLDVKWGPP